MDADHILYNLKDHIQSQTDVIPNSQLLLLDDEHFEIKVGANTAGNFQFLFHVIIK